MGSLMAPPTKNLLDNHWFALADYGTAGVTVTNKMIVNRWKLEGTAASGKVTVTPNQTTPSSTLVDKDARAQNCLGVAVSSSYNPASETVQIRQRVEAFQRECPAHLVLRAIVLGDDGAQFTTTIGDESVVTTCRGANVPVTAVLNRALTGITTDYLIVDMFTQPTPGASFQVVAASLEKMYGVANEEQWAFRSRAEERMRCRRYAAPIGSGMWAHANGDGTVDVAFAHDQMRLAPGILAVASSATWQQRPGGTVFTSSALAPIVVSATANGSIVKLAGFTSPSTPTNGSWGVLTTDNIAVLNSDY